MTLSVEIIGKGPDIVFLHGWGMNSEVWFETVDELSNNYRVTLIDLPGFGKNANVNCEFQLDKLTECILPHVPQGAILVGWSMGGLIAMNITLKYPERIQKLVLISCNAQFSASANWPAGMKAEVLDGFVKNLSEDYKQTLQRFLMLQARGGDNAKETVRALKQRLYKHGEPAQDALRGGLQLLKNTSFVDQLNEIKLPVLLMFGKLDALVPVAAAEEMMARFPQAQLIVFPKAAHAPFISHFKDFISAFNNFLTDK